MKRLKADFLSRPKAGSFSGLLKSWEKKYGSSAAIPLVQLARDPGLPDPDRYIAVMGAAKLGGSPIAPYFVSLLRDHSWMIRSASLRAMTALNNPKIAQAVLPSLKDPALVVRLDAVDAVEKLQPRGGVDALLATLQSRENYHAGKAQWIPEKALAVIAKLQAGNKTLAKKIAPLLAHEKDRPLQLATIKTLERLTGKSLKPGATLSEQVKAWKSAVR